MKKVLFVLFALAVVALSSCTTPTENVEAIVDSTTVACPDSCPTINTIATVDTIVKK